MKTPTLRCCIAAATLMLSSAGFSETTSQPAYALIDAGFVEDTGAANRIEAADKLRTITQEVAAAACFLHNDVEVPLATEVAQYGLDQFDVLTIALLEGDESLGIIGGEENRRARAMIEEVRADWAPISSAVVAILEDPSDATAMEQIYGHASSMLESSMTLLSKIESVHVIPSELLYADAMLLDVAGRQSLLTQRLSYLACKKWSGAGNDAYDELLRVETDQYIFGFEALLNGAPQLGIAAPPNAEIANALGSINADFGVVKAKLNELIETQSLDRARVGEFYRLLNAKMVQMEAVSALYAEHAKRIY